MDSLNSIPHSSLRQYLLAYFSDMKAKNARYSLRSFARRLGVEPSALSKLLRGKRAFSHKMILRIAKRLDLSPAEISNFMLTGGASLPGIPAPAEQTATENQANPELDYTGVTDDLFFTIADWYHYGILEAMTLEGAQGDPQWIARKLGISELECKLALERLIRLKLIEKSDGKYRSTGKNLSTVNNPFSKPAFRKLQKQILQQALAALDNIPYEERDQSSMTMAIDKQDLPKAKEMLKKFRRQFDKTLSQSPQKNSVYQLSLSFFPVSTSGIDDKPGYKETT